MEESIIKNKEICVLIVDDHPVIRLGLRGLLGELKVNNRTEAVLAAVERGFVNLSIS
jgi:DNA-binding NarL/FixJ family response regulator